MNRAILSGILALMVAAFVAGCATSQVRVYKTAPATVNGEAVRWDNDWGSSTRGGFNRQTLENTFIEQNIDPVKLVIHIDHDERHCSAGKSLVFLTGRFTYMGQNGSFSIKQDKAKHVGGIPTPKSIHSKCNHTASRALAIGVISAIQRMMNPNPPPQQQPNQQWEQAW